MKALRGMCGRGWYHPDIDPDLYADIASTIARVGLLAEEFENIEALPQAPLDTTWLAEQH